MLPSDQSAGARYRERGARTLPVPGRKLDAGRVREALRTAPGRSPTFLADGGSTQHNRRVDGAWNFAGVKNV